MARLRSANGLASLIDVVFSKLLSQNKVSDLTSGFFVMVPKSLCIAPFVNTHISVSGGLKPCCEYADEHGNIETSTVSAAWRSDRMDEIRKMFAEGKTPAGCARCTEREKSGARSLRDDYNTAYQYQLKQLSLTDVEKTVGDFPISLDLRFSNLCNLKCRSCYHGYSSKWFGDAKKMGLTVGDKAVISSFKSPEDFAAQIAPGMQTIQTIYFAGGEPLMLDEHYNLLSDLIKNDRTDINLAYNSNMSFLSLRDKSIVELWKHFPSVALEASIDAVGELGALVRNGFNWETFQQNIATVREECPHVSITFGVTVSVMTIAALPSLCDGLVSACKAKLSDIAMRPLQEPSFYRMQVMPADMKQTVARKLRDHLAQLRISHVGDECLPGHIQQIEGMISFMYDSDYSAELPEFVRMASTLDQLRREDTEALVEGFSDMKRIAETLTP